MVDYYNGYKKPRDDTTELLEDYSEPQPAQEDTEEPPVHKVPFFRQDLVRNGIPRRSKKGQPRR